MATEDGAGCQVAILAGGAGTRLKARTGDLPKPMAPIFGTPVLEHLIDMCRRHGQRRIALLVHYEHQVFTDHFGDGSRFGVEITYVVERQARGTAGAMADALGFMASRFLVLYGDTYADVDLGSFLSRHVASEADASLLLHPNDHPHDSDLVELGETGLVHAVHAYPHPHGSAFANLVNAALYAFQRDAVGPFLPVSGKADLAKHTFPAMLTAGRKLNGIVTPEYIKDMGTPERLDKVEHDIAAGLPERLSTRGPRTAVFLDRDGTLNEEVSHLSSPGELRLIEGTGSAIRRLNRMGTLAICVTNQPVLARGDVSWAGLRAIHAELDSQLGEENAYLDRLYFCPHHPDGGFPGEVVELKINCDCRKPATGLIDQAVRELDIDRRSSWMIGDTTSDVLAGLRAGLRTVLVRTGHSGMDEKFVVEPDYVMRDVADAVDWILQGHAAMTKRLLPVAQAAAGTRLVLIGGPARAGKTTAARVLKETLTSLGTVAHIISIDGWLRPGPDRDEGGGLNGRYNLEELSREILAIVGSRVRTTFAAPTYDRGRGGLGSGRTVCVGPDDTLVLEGVPALLLQSLCETASVRLYLDSDDTVRRSRLLSDYSWRRVRSLQWEQALESRELDEVSVVRAFASNATHSFLIN